MTKFACVAVTFFPDSDAIKNLNRLAKICPLLVIIDNTPHPSSLTLEEDEPNIILRKYRKNKGLAKALNDGICIAAERGFENIFLLDQDTWVTDGFFHHMLDFKEKMEKSTGVQAIYASNFWDRNSYSFAKFPLLEKFWVRHLSCTAGPLGHQDGALIAITSGTLIDYTTYHKIGPFREDYFIDFIDNEYCLRAARHGCKIFVNCAVSVNHSIGYRSKRRLLGVTVKPNHHLPIRRYYIARNGVRTAIEYFRSYPSFSALLLARLAHEIASILFFEKNKGNKLKGLILGFLHGISGKMGEYPFTY
ncbi:MAG: hypothetical protein DRP09_14610 [Candidatus Thorarchaeota archaeon]|nr:MAG: hypothetical protein DRP09_14610 [Candidatus Thorarchaeota archaeon]